MYFVPIKINAAIFYYCAPQICQSIEIPIPVDLTLVEGQSWRLTRTDKLKRSALYEKVRKRDEKKQTTQQKDWEEDEGMRNIPKRGEN